MQYSNLPAGAGAFIRNENTGPNYAPAASTASTAWWSGPNVDGPLDQRFQGDFTISPELLAMRNSGHQHHVNDSTAFRGIPENSVFSHSETADDRTFCYPPDSWCPPPVDDDLTQAYIWSQFEQSVWCDLGKFPPSLQGMSSQLSTEPLPMPPQEQSAFFECAWVKDDKQCGHLISDHRRKLGMHLSDFHGIHGNDKKEVTCFWQGCNQKMQRGGIGRHIISCHMKTKWVCENCLKSYSRRDAMKKHAKDCQGA